MANNNNYHKPKKIILDIQFTDSTYVDEAEEVITTFKNKNDTFSVQKSTGRNYDQLTTSQIRNLLSLTSTIYDEVLATKDISTIQDKLAYLRVQFVYQSGRNEAVKYLVELAQILEILKKVQKSNTQEDVIRFCRYMEALVAYFKYYGGRD